jgi:hypothetical protein
MTRSRVLLLDSLSKIAADYDGIPIDKLVAWNILAEAETELLLMGYIL